MSFAYREEFSHFYYRIEDDFNLHIKHLKEENEELILKKTNFEADLRNVSFFIFPQKII